MAVFIFGAGATRGASFVSPKSHPCLPPLDRDFFTQLQRVQNPKHETLISEVMSDVVELFGQNFDVTMETVFATLEHTVRMLEITGENRAFKKRDLTEKRKRLEQSIAMVLEDALTEITPEGGSRQSPRPCDFHEKFVKEILRPKDEILSFNYDCLLDYTLKKCGDGKWNAKYGYGLPLGPRGAHLRGDDHWQPGERATREQTTHLYKLHGSLHFLLGSRDARPDTRLKQLPYSWRRGRLRFNIIPPESQKAYDKGVFANLWKGAAAAIHRAQHLIVIGYSLQPTDLHSTALLRTSVGKEALRSLIIVNPDREARRRIRSVLQRGMNASTRVLSYDRFGEFIRSQRRAWEV